MGFGSQKWILFVPAKRGLGRRKESEGAAELAQAVAVALGLPLLLPWKSKNDARRGWQRPARRRRSW